LAGTTKYIRYTSGTYIVASFAPPSRSYTTSENHILPFDLLCPISFGYIYNENHIMATEFQLPVMTIPLNYEVDVNADRNEITAQFHMSARDKPGGETHRLVAAEESQNGFVSSVEIIDLFHGNTVVYEEGDGIEKGATFICFKFRFLREKFAPTRNFRHATITLTFDDELHRAGKEPEIIRIAPDVALPSNITVVGNETIQSFDAKHMGLGFGIQKKTAIESTAKCTIKGKTK